jgi:hypothetical protein
MRSGPGRRHELGNWPRKGTCCGCGVRRWRPASLHPYAVGPTGVAEYYAAQPTGMTAVYTLRETRALSDGLVLGYLTVDFGFSDRATLTVYLSVIIRRDADGWRIAHYQVSRLD